MAEPELTGLQNSSSELHSFLYLGEVLVKVIAAEAKKMASNEKGQSGGIWWLSSRFLG